MEGHGYEITGADVWAAYGNTMRAAERAGRAAEVHDRVRMLVAGETFGERFVTKVLGRELRLRIHASSWARRSAMACRASSMSTGTAAIRADAAPVFHPLAAPTDEEIAQIPGEVPGA